MEGKFGFRRGGDKMEKEDAKYGEGVKWWKLGFHFQ